MKNVALHECHWYRQHEQAQKCTYQHVQTVRQVHFHGGLSGRRDIYRSGVGTWVCLDRVKYRIFLTHIVLLRSTSPPINLCIHE
jgi:hypothetical protein